MARTKSRHLIKDNQSDEFIEYSCIFHYVRDLWHSSNINSDCQFCNRLRKGLVGFKLSLEHYSADTRSFTNLNRDTTC